MSDLRTAAQQAPQSTHSPECYQWHHDCAVAEVERLRAALAEPVAWYFEARHIDSAWAAAVTLKHPGPEGKYMRKVTPLYTAPPQRKPLTDYEIADVYLEWDAAPGRSMADFARAVERAHGIGTEARATLSSPRGSLGEEA